MISKTLSSNDLGLTGSHQAGITVPKAGQLFQFFPALNPEIINPRLELDAYDEVLGAEIKLYYIYYNGKLHGTSTRNEFRLTGLTRFFKLHNAAPGNELRFTMLNRNRIGISILSETTMDRADTVGDAPVRIKLSGKWSTYRKARQ